MDICFEGIGQMVATFAAKEKLVPGVAVSLTGDGTVGLGESGEPLCGVTVSAARGGAVAVQIGGVVKVGYSDSAAPTVGYAALTCDGTGKVTAGSGNGASCLVLTVDTKEKTAVIKL